MEEMQKSFNKTVTTLTEKVVKSQEKVSKPYLNHQPLPSTPSLLPTHTPAKTTIL